MTTSPAYRHNSPLHKKFLDVYLNRTDQTRYEEFLRDFHNGKTKRITAIRQLFDVPITDGAVSVGFSNYIGAVMCCTEGVHYIEWVATDRLWDNITNYYKISDMLREVPQKFPSCEIYQVVWSIERGGFIYSYDCYFDKE
jgi:hypothetical protein